MVVHLRVLGLAVASLAVGCTCGHGESAPVLAPTSPVAATEVVPTVAAQTVEAVPPAPSACLSERCLAHIVGAADEWALFERFGVPDPDSVVWIEPAGRQEYVEAARLEERDLPARCRPADADCYATWEMRVVGVPPVESGCPRATIELQLLLHDGESAEQFRVGSPRRFEDDFVGIEGLDAGACDAAADEIAHERAQRASAPATPIPVPAAPVACADLDASIAVFAGTRSGDQLVLTEQLSGPEDDAPFPRTYALEAADLDGDGADEGIVTTTSEVGDDGELERDCGNYGECRQGAVLRCDAGWAVVLVPQYRFGLSVGTTRTLGDRAFRILVETTRLGDDQADEAERIDDGRPLFATSALVMGRRGYAGAGSADWYESGQCARLYRAGFLADARVMCEQGLVAHPQGRVRAALHYDLGRVLQAQGHIEEARDAYRRSLEVRENATVRAHLEALPAP